MKKNKQYFLRMAIMKTMAFGLLYLFMPLLAKIYAYYVGYDYVGYTIFGASLLILFNIILLCRSWALVFDDEFRRNYLREE
jgi:hypothetical protein